MTEDIEKLSCETCKKEIPQSVALTVEGSDYVHHFCCPECRDHFLAEDPDKKPMKD